MDKPYKTKVQELCQQKFWTFPKYSSIKEGPAHNPRFGASVIVNGVSFTTQNFARTSREAHNEAAKLAFDHFTSNADAQTSSSSGCSVSSAELNNVEIADETLKPENVEELREKDPQIHEQESDVGGDDKEVEEMMCLYKNQLNNFVQGRKLDLPVYAHVCEGRSHALRFKAAVTVGGRTFDSPSFFSSLKEAEQAAAKAALTSLLSDGFQKTSIPSERDESSCFKNLLQNLVQKEGFSMPIYKTRESGAPHMRIFFSTVEVEKEIFSGKAAKSKRQAEIKAAEAAWLYLKAGKLSRTTARPSLGCQPQEALSSSSQTNLVDLQQNHEQALSVVTPRVGYKDNSKDGTGEDQENFANELLEDNKAASPNDKPSSSVPTELPITGMNRWLLCNRVLVYSRKPDVALTTGTTLLPIGDDMWVAVNMDFGNHEGLGDPCL